MNGFQDAWWTQAKSDYEVFHKLNLYGAHECHLLHYLQMSTEKLAKAYFWRDGNPPPKSHAGFTKFLRFLGHGRGRVHEIFEFGNVSSFQNWIRTAVSFSREIEHLAPTLAVGPNPEYPWPHDSPLTAPASYHFPLWQKFQNESRGRIFLDRFRTAINRFPEYCDQ
ncbi:hypothetical protein [Lacunimicrobium album]